MTPRTKGGILDAVAITGIAYAANSVGRLNVPDSLAGMPEYGWYVALPFVCAVVCALWGTAYKPSPIELTPAGDLDGCRKSLGDAAAKMIARGDMDSARKLCDAADVAMGTKK